MSVMHPPPRSHHLCIEPIELIECQPRVHISKFLAVVQSSPDMLRYVSFPSISNEADFMSKFYEKHISSSLDDCLYAITDKANILTQPDSNNYAGIASLSGTDPVNAVTELGIIVFPEFQRTHVSSNAVGLLLLWTLDPPSAGGLGLRRVAWKTHAQNAASCLLASRMGFEFEGIARWDRVFPEGQDALPVEALEKRNGTKGESPGRHTASFSIVWDEWDEKRPNLLKIMERTC